MSSPIGTVQVHDQEPTPRIAIAGEIDLSNANEILAQVGSALNGAAEALLDLREVTFMGSDGVRLIHELSKSMEDRGGIVILVDRGGIPHQVLSLTRMEERVRIITDIAEFGPPG